MDRMIQANVIGTSGRAVEAAGDVDVLLLDKTGTITMGNRQAVEFVPARGIELPALADAAQIASLADETPEGRSIVVLAKEKYGLRGREISAGDALSAGFHGWAAPQDRGRPGPTALFLDGSRRGISVRGSLSRSFWLLACGLLREQLG
jgi:hypothetical protein